MALIIRINGTPIMGNAEGEIEKLIASVEKLNYKQKLAITSGLMAMLNAPAVALAAEPGKIEKAFQPILSLLQDLASPVCQIMFIVGFIMIIIGRPRQGVDKMKWAAIGYIGIHWIPMLMGIVSEAGKGV